MANERDCAVGVVKGFLEAAAPFKSATCIAILDNVSTDGTLEILRSYANSEPRLSVIYAPENRCRLDAYSRGYREALSTKADWILEVDAGFSHRPEDLKNFFPAMLAGDDAIFATRFAKGGKMLDCPLPRRLISRGGTMLTNLLLGTRLSDMTSGYEMFRPHALEYALQRGLKSRGCFFQTEIKAYCHHFRIGEAPITYRATSSTSVSSKILGDALWHLSRLFGLRLKGALI